jgi:hypothetical protein
LLELRICSKQIFRKCQTIQFNTPLTLAEDHKTNSTKNDLLWNENNFGFERALWRLFMKRAVCTKFNIYVSFLSVGPKSLNYHQNWGSSSSELSNIFHKTRADNQKHASRRFELLLNLFYCQQYIIIIRKNEI